MKKDFDLARRLRGDEFFDRRDFGFKTYPNEINYSLPYFDVRIGMESL